MTIRFALGALFAVALAACNGDAPAEDSAADADRSAQGEVLGGTISDDMLPLDAVRSQSPPLEAPREPGAAASPTSAAAPSAPDESEEPAPAAEPAPPSEDG